MKKLKAVLLFVLMAGSVAGCLLSYGIWQEQRDMLDGMDREMAMEHSIVYKVSIEDDLCDYDSGMAQEAIDEEKAKLDELEQEAGLFQMKYDLLKFVETQGNTQGAAVWVYQKYFHVRQGELARIAGIEELADCGTYGFLNNPFSGVVFELYDGITLQYKNGTTSQIEEYGLPIAVVITGKESGLGFMEARAGMDFRQIVQSAYEEEIKQGFMYFSNDCIYYIQYTDDVFRYTFVSENEDGSGSKLIVTQLDQEIPQVGWTSKNREMQSTSYAYWMEAAPLEEIGKNHEILVYDISTSPRYDYENTPLREVVDRWKEEDEEWGKENDVQYEMEVDYHLFDFNDDGIEDYVLCVDGRGYCGSGGHYVKIFVGKEDGGVEEVMDQVVRFHNYNTASGHESFTVLNEKTGGFYAIVLPGGKNRILRYDPQTGGYELQETE